ncbi:bile acid:sodium symporter family protein [Lentibacter algarum]|uniref:bile acid:sodium symporter family protein n=1 Tax=Lentibacter algarum TaxID=576131 RepID=UPI001C0A525D|nr:bile acid:sodium symporter [Lentibacter algarum]MBU2983416.1 bile acid:sodium symporter family protein [Lentibacter algarum]
MLISVALPLSLAIIMFSLGLGLKFGDFTRVVARPVPVAIGITLQIALIPALAYLLLQVFSLPPAMAFGVMILSFCPGGVTSNMLTRFAQANVALSITLTAVVSLLSVVSVPLLTAWAATATLGAQAPEINVTSIAVAMFAITALPVFIGLMVSQFATGFATRIEGFMYKLASVLFLIITVAALATNWELFINNIGTLGPLLITLNILLLLLGAGVGRLTGLSWADAKAIALELGVQNATLGITVAGLISMSEGIGEYAVASGVYGITMYIVTLPAIWLTRNKT